MADPMREARKHGTDSPHEPTDEFVVHAFAEGARELWPDSRDPGWHVTFRRWLERRDAAARAEDAARLAEVERAFAGIRCALLHWQAEGVTQGVSCANCQSWAKSIAMPFFTARTSAALGVTAPTASEAGDAKGCGWCGHGAGHTTDEHDAHVATLVEAGCDKCGRAYDWTGDTSPGAPCIGCGRYPAANPAPAEASEVEGSDRG